jgi:signal transduction histidine kinase
MDEFLAMIHEDDRELMREAVSEATRRSGSYEMKYRLNNDTGNRTFLSRGKVMLDGNGRPVTLVGSIQDVTLKQRREQFREELIKQKDLFISRLGHDLKTPLTPLVALLPLIRSRVEDKRQLELLDLCINNVSYISALVSKTLLLARLTASDAVASRRLDIQLSVLVDSVVSCNSDTITDQILIENHVSPDIVVRGNRTELEELFSQLFSNAAKFSPAGSNVVVEARHEGDMVAISVQDNGMGLFPEEMVHIFEDFYKADPSRHVLGSCGLGLTICRRIVESHGGRISASSPGRDCGTTISFTLESGGRT